MPLLFDPLYPIQVQYVVSQSIWELYEIHFWQILFKTRGKTDSFHLLRYRYEKNRREGPVLLFMALVFAISYIILYVMNWRERQRNVSTGQPVDAQNNGSNNENDIRQKENTDDNVDQQSASSEQIAEEKREKK